MSDWEKELEDEYKKPYYKQLYNFVINEYKDHTVYPPKKQIRNALHKTPLDNVKCVILGQDPYHGKGQAMGLSFSVNKNVPIPPSLMNIYNEINREFAYDNIPKHGDLTYWTEQGVLLLNAILTVRAGQPASHRNKGWENYTDAILQILNRQQRPIVYMLWGNYAKAKAQYLNNPQHLILQTSHPSPYSVNYGFNGCGHFKTCNEFLENHGITPIDWHVPDENKEKES